MRNEGGTETKRKFEAITPTVGKKKNGRRTINTDKKERENRCDQTGAERREEKGKTKNGTKK